MTVTKKLNIKQLKKRLDISFDNILDLVDDGLISMYVYSVSWEFYNLDDHDDLIKYLMENVSGTLENYKVPSNLSSYIRMIKKDKGFALPPPEKASRPKEYKDLETQFIKSIVNELDIYRIDFPIDNETGWDDYFESRDENQTDDCDVNRYEYYEQLDTGEFKDSDEGRTFELEDDGYVHEDTFKITQNLDKLLEKVESGTFYYEEESFQPMPKCDWGLGTICVSPTPNDLSEVIEFSNIYFLEEDILKLEHVDKSTQGSIKLGSQGHTSELLKYLEALINEFWIDYDPNNPPTNYAMAKWLGEQSDRFYSNGDKDNPNQLATYMARITRPDNLK